MAAFNLACMPPVATWAAINSWHSATVRDEQYSPSASRTPATSVRKKSWSASKEAAQVAAIWSALTLIELPFAVAGDTGDDWQIGVAGEQIQQGGIGASDLADKA